MPCSAFIEPVPELCQILRSKTKLRDLCLQVLGAGPTVANPLPVVELADGSSLNYTIPDNTFQLNKPYGGLTLSATLQSGGTLPSWLSIDASGEALLLSGTPSIGSDQSYQLNITASDSDGDKNSTMLDLEVRAACPFGLFRHFRCGCLPLWS